MHFGIFTEEMRQGSSQAQAFREELELADAAEAWGLDGVWLGELHFTPARSVLSAPIVVASAIAARTRRLRVGTAVQVLPLGNPLRFAEEIATLDQLSEGRFDFGIGRSGSPRVYQVYGIPYAESQARFREALEIILEAWKGAPFSYRGEHYRVDNAAVSPRPYQQPHPPIRMAATGADTFPRVAAMGLPIFVGLRGMDIPELRGHLGAYRAAWREAGHPGAPSVYLRIPIYAAPTEAAAVEEPCETITYYFQRQAELARAGLGAAIGGPDAERLAQVEHLAGLTYPRILDTKVALGTGTRLIARLGELRDELGLDGIVAELNPGGLLPVEQVMRSLRIIAGEVIPAFR